MADVGVLAGKSIGVDAVKALAISHVEIAKIMAPAIVDASKVLGYDAAKALADSNLEAAQVLASASIDASKTLGADAAKAFADGNLAIVEKIMPYVGPAIVVGVAAYSVIQIQPIAKDTYGFMFPTEKQIALDKAETNAARELSAFYEARANLRKCFIGSKTEDKRNDEGYPTICEKTVQAFIVCGGESEVDRMIAGFNKHWK